MEQLTRSSYDVIDKDKNVIVPLYQFVPVRFINIAA